MSEQVYFYQNNPCTIVNEINDDFVEISINHKYGAEMELMCMGCAVGDSDNKLSCTCSEHEWVVEQVQDEDHLCLVIARRIYLRENPVEHHDIERLKKKVTEERESFSKTKALHEEWRLSLKAKQQKFESLNLEIKSLNKSIVANEELRRQSESGLSDLTDEYNKIAVHIGTYSRTGNNISTKEYNELLKRDEILRALEVGGVGNWQWYDESMKAANL